MTQNSDTQLISVEAGLIPSPLNSPAADARSAAGVLSTPKNHLDGLAECVRQSYRAGQAAWHSFNEHRFFIGCCLLKARDVIASAAGGDRRSEGFKIDKVSNLIGSEGSTSENPQDSNGLTVIAEKLRDPHANFTKADAGLVIWIKREFPHIQERTLYRYREWTEKHALPVLQKARQQLELPMGDLVEVNPSQLAAPVREKFNAALKAAVTSKDLTLTLRSMGEAEGDPEHYGPKGGARRPHDRRTKAQIAQDEWAAKAKAWTHRIQPMADEALANALNQAHYWDTLDDAKLDELRASVFDLYTGLQASQARRRTTRTNNPATGGKR